MPASWVGDLIYLPGVLCSCKLGPGAGFEKQRVYTWRGCPPLLGWEGPEPPPTCQRKGYRRTPGYSSAVAPSAPPPDSRAATLSKATNGWNLARPTENHSRDRKGGATHNFLSFFFRRNARNPGVDSRGFEFSGKLGTGQKSPNLSLFLGFQQWQMMHVRKR